MPVNTRKSSGNLLMAAADSGRGVEGSGLGAGSVSPRRIVLVANRLPAAGFAGGAPARRRGAERCVAGRIPRRSGGLIGLPDRLELTARQGSGRGRSRLH